MAPANDDDLVTPHKTVANFTRRLGITIDQIGIAPRVVVSWGRRVVEILATSSGAENIAQWLYADRQPLYTGQVGGRPVSFVQLPVGAPGTVMVMEELAACGVHTFIVLGWAGSLQETAPIGSLIIPSACLSEEGTSRHYFDPPVQYHPDLPLADALEACAARHSLPVQRGLLWTTDAPYRESRSKVEAYRAQGVLGVDMETSAMYALGMFRGFSVCNLLVVSDELGRDWNMAFGTDQLIEATKKAIQVVLDCLAGL
jgi:uridine phosphorylase